MVEKLQSQNFAKLSSNMEFHLKWNWVSFIFVFPPTRESSEIVGIWINFFSNISRDTQGDLKTAFKKFEVIFQPKLFEVIFQNYVIQTWNKVKL